MSGPRNELPADNGHHSPSPPFWYSYDYGSVHFATVSSEHDLTPDSKQIKVCHITLQDEQIKVCHITLQDEGHCRSCCNLVSLAEIASDSLNRALRR